MVILQVTGYGRVPACANFGVAAEAGLRDP
jgi:hypothetical protein